MCAFQSRASYLFPLVLIGDWRLCSGYNGYRGKIPEGLVRPWSRQGTPLLEFEFIWLDFFLIYSLPVSSKLGMWHSTYSDRQSKMALVYTKNWVVWQTGLPTYMTSCFSSGRPWKSLKDFISQITIRARLTKFKSELLSFIQPWLIMIFLIPTRMVFHFLCFIGFPAFEAPFLKVTTSPPSLLLWIEKLATIARYQPVLMAQRMRSYETSFSTFNSSQCVRLTKFHRPSI